MIFNNIAIKTTTLGTEMISDMLLIAGITSFSISDPNDFLQIIEEKSVPFDYYESNILPADTNVATVNVYLAETEQGMAQKELIFQGISDLKAQNQPYGELSIEVTKTDDKNWENNWKQYFHPLNIGEKFVIKPSWETCAPNGRHILEIDPESSFGTGQHETTRLCLEILETLDVAQKSILDMGCGSGILGIGACLLGANSVVAVDIDENAVKITKKNAVVNNLSPNVLTAYAGNFLTDKSLENTIKSHKYDIITANIVADILILMLSDFCSVLNENGVLILSGIISTRKETVLDALKNDFNLIQIKEDNDWVAILAKIKQA
ncbi:MAG: 50S ribosomal protein L11 methyltransferase [Clostridia bacterium]